jgi:LPXTG-motif cell wall-anchored protein
MKTSTQKRIARPSGLLLLSLLVVALAVPAAQAFPSQRSTLVQLAQAHRDRDRQTVAASGTSNAAQSQPGWAWGFYYSDAGASKLLAAGAQGGYYSTVAGSGTVNIAQRPTTAQLRRAHNAHGGPSGVSGGGTANAAQSASSGISSTSVWIAAAAVLGAVLIGGWALLRRRRRREAAPACEFSAQGC